MASLPALPNAPQPTSESTGTSSTHTSVMPQEVLDFLGPRPDGVYIDATAGGGGHSEAILLASSSGDSLSLAVDPATPVGGRVLSIDADPAAVKRVSQRLQRFDRRTVVVHSNFRHLSRVAIQQGFARVDGILLDLGLSSFQLGDPERGFALMADGPLDMRFDPEQDVSAADLVNRLDEKALADLIYHYGEERYSRRIARAIIAARPLYTTGELAAVIGNTIARRERIHPATRTFQALRIAVNEELAVLSDVLPQAVKLLRPGGHLVVISFHSLEDRIVKNFFRREATDCICPKEVIICECGHRASLRVLTKKPLRPSQNEVTVNPRSRSARLRAAEKLPDSIPDR
ncbi:MAG: 16S rRNA (cytosine(1402)-N(4))-methyltransferase RsmH [Chloroflexota bacterium]|nr:16S rRNA (cytosine(1402)-N(4))-methyltransferase RsmH [Chloroflexota bacterium]